MESSCHRFMDWMRCRSGTHFCSVCTYMYINWFREQRYIMLLLESIIHPGTHINWKLILIKISDWTYSVALHTPSFCHPTYILFIKILKFYSVGDHAVDFRCSILDSFFFLHFFSNTARKFGLIFWFLLIVKLVFEFKIV